MGAEWVRTPAGQEHCREKEGGPWELAKVWSVEETPRSFLFLFKTIRAPAPREGLIPVKRGATRHDCTLKGQLGFPSLSQQRRKRAPRNPEVTQVGGAGFKEPQTAGLPLASGPSPDVEQNRTIGQGWVHLWCGVWKFPSCPESGIANPRSPKKRFPEDQVSQ